MLLVEAIEKSANVRLVAEHAIRYVDGAFMGLHDGPPLKRNSRHPSRTARFVNLLRPGVEVQPPVALRHGLRGHSPAMTPEAGEVIAMVRTAMLARLPYTGLSDEIFSHPTMTEGLNVLWRTCRR